MLLLGKAGSCYARAEGHISINVRVLRILAYLKDVIYIHSRGLGRRFPTKYMQQTVAVDRHEVFACITLIC